MKICSCGTCQDAVERAVQFVCKMIDDDECQLFIFSVGMAMRAIAEHTAGNMMECEMEKNPLAGLRIAMEHDKAMNAVLDEYQKPVYTDIMNDRLRAYFERRKEESKLPKDH